MVDCGSAHYPSLTRSAVFTVIAHPRPAVAWGSVVGDKPLTHCEVISGGNSGRGTAYCSLETVQAFISRLFGPGPEWERMCAGIERVVRGEWWPPQWNPWLSGVAVRDLSVELGISVTQLSSAISGIDNALWSLRAKQMGKSLTAVLREYVAQSPQGSLLPKTECDALAYCTIEISQGTDFAGVQARLLPLLQKGVHAFKLWSQKPFGNFGLMPLSCDHLRHARKVVGPDVLLFFEGAAMQDGWLRRGQQDWARQLCGVLRQENYLWLEEPLRLSDDDALTQYKQLRIWNEQIEKSEHSRRLDYQLKLAGCESLVGFDSFLAWSDSVDLFQPDGCICGGLSVMMQLKLRFLSVDKPVVGHGFADALAVYFDTALVEALGSTGSVFDRLVEVPEHCLVGRDQVPLRGDGTIAPCSGRSASA